MLYIFINYFDWLRLTRSIENRKQKFVKLERKKIKLFITISNGYNVNINSVSTFTVSFLDIRCSPVQ